MSMALLDSTIVDIAIPAILSDLKTTIIHVSWVLNAYNLGLAVLFLSGARGNRRRERRGIGAAGPRALLDTHEPDGIVEQARALRKGSSGSLPSG